MDFSCHLLYGGKFEQRRELKTGHYVESTCCYCWRHSSLLTLAGSAAAAAASPDYARAACLLFRAVHLDI